MTTAYMTLVVNGVRYPFSFESDADVETLDYMFDEGTYSDDQNLVILLKQQYPAESFPDECEVKIEDFCIVQGGKVVLRWEGNQ